MNKEEFHDFIRPVAVMACEEPEITSTMVKSKGESIATLWRRKKTGNTIRTYIFRNGAVIRVVYSSSDEVKEVSSDGHELMV